MSGMFIGGGTSTPSSGTGMYRPLDMGVLSSLGIEEEEEELQGNPFGRFIKSLNAGIGVGVLDPFSFIKPVGRYVEGLKQEAEASGGGGSKIGYGAGFLTGFLLPGGLAAKGATYGVRGLQAATGLKLLRAADAGTEFTRLGMLTQGAIAGALLEAGGDVEEGNTRIGEVARGMIIGGLGDVALQSAWRVVTGASAFGSLPAKIVGTADNIADDGIGSIDDAIDLGRAATLVDDIIRPTNPVGDDILDSITQRKQQLILGLDELGLSELEPGQLRIVPNISGNVDDIRTALNNIPGIRYAFTSRKLRTGKTVDDVLVGPVDEVDRETINLFQRYGFVPGQEGFYGGKKYILDRPSKNPDYVLGIAADATTKATPIPRSELQLGSIINPTTGGRGKLADPNAQWLSFAREYGPFPFRTNAESIGGFDWAFNSFTAGKSFTPAAKEQLRLYFSRRQNEFLKTIDDGELSSVLDNVTKAPVGNRAHPSGQLEELAATRGLIPKRIQVEGKKGKRWQYALVDVDSGQAHGPFKTPKIAAEFLRAYDKRMARIDPDGPLAEGATGLPAKGTGVQQLINQAEFSNATVPWSLFSAYGSMMPNLHWIRRVNDSLTKQLGDNAPDLYSAFLDVFQATNRMRSEATPYLERLTKIRGGGLLSSSKLRVDKYDDIGELLEHSAPGSKSWLAKADELGLTPDEKNVTFELRKLFNDAFKVAEEAGNIDITADDFVENYLPHIWRRGEHNWVKSYTKAHGKPPSVKVKNFIHEFERTGELTIYEKDPFKAAYLYINSLFAKKNTSDSWSRLRAVIDTIPEEMGPGQPNFGLIQLKQTALETAAIIRGNPLTTHYGTRALVQSASKQFNLHLDENTIDRFTSTLISLNYGAFMGWRVALAARNLSQIVMTGLPVLGPKYLASGIRKALREGEGELIEQGILARGQYGLPFEDMLFYDNVRKGAMTMGKKEAVSKTAAKVGAATRYLTQQSLRPQAWSDSVNRRVVYYGAKDKMLDALTRWSKEGLSRERFDEVSGLSAMGPTVARDFHRMIPRENPIQAAKWYAAQVTNDTQFVYQAGAGPRAFNSRAGKLFGMYGTWPSWYASLIEQRLRYGTPVDKARFIGYTTAVHLGFMNMAYLTGINMSKWTGLQFGWAGGPAFDIVKDLSDIVEGEQVSGEPTAERELALSKYGVRDPGTGLFEIRDPRRLIEGTAGLFFPGMYAVRDVREAMKEENPIAGGMRAMGFQLEQ
jgi:hypothetical protein